MKVVLFCGGLGTRLREHSDTIPKPLVNVGYRPIIWHLMRYYAHFGHKDFVLCLGYRGEMIREYFLNYEECMSNDFTLSGGGRKVDLHSSDIEDWRITFVDTGLHANIGERLLAVRKYVAGRGDVPRQLLRRAVELPLDTVVDDFQASKRGGDLRLGAAVAELSLRDVRRRRPGAPHRVGAAMPTCDQRWLLRAAAGDLRLHAAGRGTRRAAVLSA